MGSVNRVILVGNLGRDAEVRYTPGGAAVATLNLATTETWKDKAGERHEQTEWHRVVLWGKAAESLSEYLVKGKQIYVEGRLQTRKWQDKDGNDKYTTEVRADRVTLLGGGGNGERRTSGEPRSGVDRETAESTELDDVNIPFAWVLPLLLPALGALLSAQTLLA